ncbi:MAG: 4-hydroxy-tetrahydrodipicolinate reductase [Gammaproteobacteria bacterium]|nr:4-hydroxy-tetrahydrodipicolinate reductase [Gammaproteobacteria bacterium]MDE2023466.1 4-hydroxy-tetrahydrodipicolinate reductase [Gammaproteobacteria bacterium]MDE2139422.1 4-hydroxy-tetrahydrodipicolinate reductase [Gammaproteobacteria bacterium]
MNTKTTGTMTRIALLGAAGRMGRTILELARGYSGVTIAAAVVPAGRVPAGPPPGLAWSTDLRAALLASDVLLDFSVPSCTLTAVDACVAAGKPLVTGVTGLDNATRAKLAAASRRIAVLAAPNMSLGANLLLALTRTAAAALGEEYDLEITDIHHRGKRDAPSGTALALAEAAAAVRHVRLEERVTFMRHGASEPRRPGSIGIASVRAGDAAGEHRVLFGGPAESLELTHRATSRAAFARGALAAAQWIVGRPAGEYSVAAVLNLPVS